MASSTALESCDMVLFHNLFSPNVPGGSVNIIFLAWFATVLNLDPVQEHISFDQGHLHPGGGGCSKFDSSDRPS